MVGVGRGRLPTFVPAPLELIDLNEENCKAEDLVFLSSVLKSGGFAITIFIPIFIIIY